MSTNILGLNPSANNPATPLVTGVVTSVGAPNPNTPFVVDLLSAYSAAAMTTVVTGGPASCTIQLQGSMDGTNWTTIATSTSTTGDTQPSTTGVQFSTLRVNVNAVSGGTSPTVALAVAAYGAGAVGGGSAVTGTVTSNQGTKGAAANAWPVVVGNAGGTNQATVNSSGGLGVSGTATTPFVGGILFTQGSDGTNVTPTMDTAARAGYQNTLPTPATAANVLCGSGTAANTVAAQTLITVPAGRTWYGSVSTEIVAAGTALVSANINTAGTGVTPAAAVNLVTVSADPTTAVGDVSNQQSSGSFYVVAPGGNSVTLTLTNTSATTNTSHASALGILL